MDRKQFRLSGGGTGESRGNRWKNAGFIALVVLFGLIIWAAFNQPSQLKSVPISQVISDANGGKTQKITISGDNLAVTPKGEAQLKNPARQFISKACSKAKLCWRTNRLPAVPTAFGDNCLSASYR
jgi:hypothetical protein